MSWSFLYKYQMSMNRNALIFVLGAISSIKAELFDVTTIIRYKTLPQLEQGKNNASLVDRSQVTITVHARNNALGLPIFLEDGSVVSANVGVDVEECSPYIGRCDWQAENMILGNNSSAPFTSTVPTNVWSLVGKKGSLSSPPFWPSYSRVCIAVTFYKDDSSTLGLELIHSQGEKIDFSYYQSIAMNEDWVTDIYIAHVPLEILDPSVLVTVKINVESEVVNDVVIQRIAGCNGRGTEDTIILSEREYHQIPTNGYDVALSSNTIENKVNHRISTKEFVSDEYKNDYSYSEPEFEIFTDHPIPDYARFRRNTVFDLFGFPDSKKTVSTSIELSSTSTTAGPVICVNGGIFVKEHGVCVCPAGFVGSTCEKGCGTNKFGSKCDGRCSKTSRGCKAMKLCRPKLGCNCGPGLKGPFCETECDAGRFGIDCQEHCGSCSFDESCDPYTGLCLNGCSDGFFPPYCKELYSHVGVIPHVYHIGFKNINVTADLKHESIKGRGSPRFYQFQYKTMSDTRWSYLEPRTMVYDMVEDVITGLLPGTTYQVRVVIYDEDGGSYQGYDIPKLEVKTKCSIPTDLQYDLQQEYTKPDSFMVFWNYSYKGSLTCQLKYFQVELNEDWSWISHYEGTNTSALFTGMLPGQDYEVRVRAVTLGGPAEYSNILKVRTMDKGPEAVFDFKLVSTNYNNVKVEWTPPLETAGTIQHYSVSYECRTLLACSHVDCSDSTGTMTVTENFAVIGNLIPHAQYAISVAAVAATEGPGMQLFAVTDMTEPQVSAKAVSKSPVSHCTNTSFTVRWNPPKDCSHQNGYLLGYRYQLVDDASSEVIREDRTQATSVSFTNLTPFTDYTVMVYLETSGGWNPAYGLSIPAKTKATVPGPVQQLTVYKRERKLLGLRWALPKEMYGSLKSFTITCKTKDVKPVKSIIEPTHCDAWPDLYCTTFGSLRPNSEHTVIVQARNEEVDEDGEPSVAYAVTKESSPDTPSNLHIVSQTQTSLQLEWGIPDMLNGRLKSFLIAIQQTGSYLASNCCVDFNVKEMKVLKEQPTYVYEATGLRPASSYTISVSAKTVTMGNPDTIVGHTKPLIPSIVGSIAIQGDMSSMSNTPIVALRPSVEDIELIRGYLLIVMPQFIDAQLPDVQPILWTDWLQSELASYINGSYYIAREFDQAELETNPEVVLGTGTEVKIGKFGIVRDPVLQGGEDYRLGLAIVLEYNGAYSVGFTQTDVFIIENSSERQHGVSVKHEGKHSKEDNNLNYLEKHSDYKDHTKNKEYTRSSQETFYEDEYIIKDKDHENSDQETFSEEVDASDKQYGDYEKRDTRGKNEPVIYNEVKGDKFDVTTKKTELSTDSGIPSTSPVLKSIFGWPWK